MPTLTELHPPVPLDELVAGIGSFPAASSEEKKSFLSQLVKSHVTLNVRWGGPWTYRRARRMDDNTRPTNVDELIWRKGVPAKLGRANPAGYDVLYVSDRQDTCLREARVVEHRVAIAEFMVRSGRSVRVAPIGEFLQVQRTGRGALLGDASDTITQHLNASRREEATSLLISDAFLQEVFCSDDTYEFSSHIARAIFDKNPGISAIAYASRQQWGATNFTVRVDTFWQDWALVGVRYGDAKHLACGFHRLSHVQAVDGIFGDGRLRWIDVGETDRIVLEPYVPVST